MSSELNVSIISEEQQDVSEPQKKPTNSTMSKKRLNDIKNVIKDKYGDDDIDDTINKICEIMKFDPDVATYNKDKGRKYMDWRKKRAEQLGITVGQYNPKLTSKK